VSGGEAQRAFIARALAQDTEIILLDEPNAHLDLKHQIDIFNLLCRLNLEKNLTVVMVSHDIILSGFYSLRTILVKDGKIFKDDMTKKVLNEKNINETFGVNASVKYSEKFDNVLVSLNPGHPKADE
jgi:iron complex transport system ATP-binding protein